MTRDEMTLYKWLYTNDFRKMTRQMNLDKMTKDKVTIDILTVNKIVHIITVDIIIVYKMTILL